MTDDTTAQVGDFISDNPDFMDALAAAQEKLFVARDMATEGTAADLHCLDVVALFGASASLYDMQDEIERVIAACAGKDRPAFWQLALPYLAVEADRRYARRNLLEQAWPHIRGLAGDLARLDAATLARTFSALVDGADEATAGDNEFRAYALAYAALSLCDEAAQRLGQPTEDIDRAIEGLYKRIHGRFANDDGSFGEGTPESYALAAVLGLGDGREMAVRLAKLACGGDVIADAITTAFTFDVLNRYGHDDVAEQWLLAGAQPNAARWLFQGLGGIRVADDAVAADHIEVRPYFSTKTDNVTCSYKTPRGQLFLTWERKGANIALTLMVPAGTQVDLWLDGALQVIPSDPDPITQAFLIEG